MTRRMELEAEIASLRSRITAVEDGQIHPPDPEGRISGHEFLLVLLAGIRPLMTPTPAQPELAREYRRLSWARREAKALRRLLSAKESALANLEGTGTWHHRYGKNPQTEIDRVLKAHPARPTITRVARRMDPPVDRGTLTDWLDQGRVSISGLSRRRGR